MDISRQGRSGADRALFILRLPRHLALRLLLLSGFVFPAIYLGASNGYVGILVSTLTPSMALVPNLTTLLAAFSLVLWSFFRYHIPKSRMWTLLVWTPGLWLSIFPSIFFLASSFYRETQFFTLAEHFYLSWIAIGTLMVPYLILGLLVSGILQFDNNILSPIGYSMSLFVLLSFIIVIHGVLISVPVHLSGQAIIGFKILYILLQMVWGTVGGPTDVQALLTGTLLYRTDTLVFPLIGAAFVMNSLGYIFYRLGYFRIFLDRLSRRNDVLAVRERPSVFTGNLRYIGSLALISVGVTYVLFAISWNYTIDPVIPLLIVFIALLLSLKRVHG